MDAKRNRLCFASRKHLALMDAKQFKKHLSRNKEVCLLVEIYRRRRKGVEISIGEPFPASTPKPIKAPKNIARFASDIKAYLTEHPETSYTDVGKHFEVSRARISQLMKIANNTPVSLFKELVESEDPNLLAKYSGKQLIKLASLNYQMKQAVPSPSL